MSTLANRQIHFNHQNKITHNTEQASDDSSVAAVSVSSRVDYIQRFSKHAALVIDQDSNAYSHQARQYLSSISQQNIEQDINVAFVSASSKINDIQMRCRLIEQLFTNALFDPEQSLAVNILRLAKQHNDIINIVVEHAQALSLQIKYELCQLVDVAQKTNNKIDVVLFGLEQAAKDISQNRTLFDKKISIVDASSGQVLAIDHARFKTPSSIISGKGWRKISLLVISSLVVIFIAWFTLLKHQNFSLATLPNKSLNHEKLQPQVIQPAANTAAQSITLASIDDIQHALQTPVKSAEELAIAQVKPAEMADILQAIADPVMYEETPPAPVKATAIESEKTLLPSEKTAIVTINSPVIASKAKAPVTLNEQYYLTYHEGYAIQIAGFSELALLTKFIDKYPGIEYFAYQKRLNSQSLFVLTTQIYDDKAQAKSAMNALPLPIKGLGIFLKPVSTIKREINIVSQ